MKKQKLPLSVLGLLALAMTASSVTTAQAEDLPDHKLSEWSLGTVVQGDTYTQKDLEGKVVVIEDWGVR